MRKSEEKNIVKEDKRFNLNWPIWYVASANVVVEGFLGLSVELNFKLRKKGHNFPRCQHFTILALSNWIKLEVQKKKQILGVNTWQSPGFSN